MADREKVAMWLRQELEKEDCLIELPYNVVKAAYKLLKDQEPRVLTDDEIIKTTEVTTCYIEVKGERNLYGAYLQKYDDDHTLVATDIKNLPEMIATRHARLWSSRPTDEQREAVPWTE